MDATWETLQRWIDESNMIMNDLYEHEASRDAAALEKITVKADAVIRLVASSRREAA